MTALTRCSNCGGWSRLGIGCQNCSLQAGESLAREPADALMMANARIAELERTAIVVRQYVDIADAIIRGLQARIKELTEWRSGVPENRERHWALVLHDGTVVPNVLLWDPPHRCWRSPDYRWSVDAERCVYLPIPEVKS